MRRSRGSSSNAAGSMRRSVSRSRTGSQRRASSAISTHPMAPAHRGLRVTSIANIFRSSQAHGIRSPRRARRGARRGRPRQEEPPCPGIGEPRRVDADATSAPSEELRAAAHLEVAVRLARGGVARADLLAAERALLHDHMLPVPVPALQAKEIAPVEQPVVPLHEVASTAAVLAEAQSSLPPQLVTALFSAAHTESVFWLHVIRLSASHWKYAATASEHAPECESVDSHCGSHSDSETQPMSTNGWHAFVHVVAGSVAPLLGPPLSDEQPANVQESAGTATGRASRNLMRRASQGPGPLVQRGDASRACFSRGRAPGRPSRRCARRRARRRLRRRRRTRRRRRRATQETRRTRPA